MSVRYVYDMRIWGRSGDSEVGGLLAENKYSTEVLTVTSTANLKTAIDAVLTNINSIPLSSEPIKTIVITLRKDIVEDTPL